MGGVPRVHVAVRQPGKGLRPEAGWRRLTTDPGTGFYLGIRRALAAIGESQLHTEVGLCCLPADSYHVTAWDGINADNLGLVNSRYREQAESYLAGLPATLAGQPPFVEVAQRGLCDWSEPLRLRFERVINWKDRVLVVQLRPAASSSPAYAEFEARREQLNPSVRIHGPDGVHVSVTDSGYHAAHQTM